MFASPSDHPAPAAVIFDLGGTLLYWNDWDEDAPRRWGLAYDVARETLRAGYGARFLPARDAFLAAMREAETAHWKRVVQEQWSGPPAGLVVEGLRLLGHHPEEQEVLAILNGYAHAVDGWALVYPDTVETLSILRERGYRIGLLSNTWWAAAWHNADLAAHGLAGLLDELVYTSDLPRSKPHPSVFNEAAARLGTEPAACVMVGDRMVDDISGAQALGMRAIWRRNTSPWPKPEGIVPTAVIDALAEIPALLRGWGGR